MTNKQATSEPQTRILICGAGIAGLTLAYWLDRYGFQVAVVEKRPEMSNAGYMMDFYGSGYDVAEKMGILDELQSQRYPLSGLTIVDRAGKVQSTVSLDSFQKLLKGRYVNVMHGNLTQVLYNYVKDRVSVRFDCTITAINPMLDAVGVELSDGTRETYDLLIGADGIHSEVRSLLWGAESQFDHFLGFYIACAVIDNVLHESSRMLMYVQPHRQASAYPFRADKLATFFAFECQRQDPTTRQEQIDLLRAVYKDMGWRTLELLEASIADPHLYFDAVVQIKLEQWHRGRVALVGDACQCMTLLAGQGASMAMGGAYILATELQRAHGDYQTAFQRYQAALKPEIDKRQVQAQGLAKTFIPGSNLRIKLQNIFLKFALLPGLQQFVLRQIGAKSVLP